MNRKVSDTSRGKHILVWEQSNLDNDVKKETGCFGTRHFVTLMLCLGMANAYTMRTNMSVAIVAMVNQTALPKEKDVITNECPGDNDTSSNSTVENFKDGTFLWSTTTQGYILSSFFYGYVFTQIPLGILAKKYGSKLFLGIGMLINSVFGLLVPFAAEYCGTAGLIVVRFIQGLGEGPIVPCTHALLAKWIPPNERSRMGAIVYAGAQFGTVIAMPVSGMLSDMDLFGGWPSIFYFFGVISLIWSIAFILTVYEDPEVHPKMHEDEKKYIISTVWGAAGVNSPPVPWKSILTSVPFYAILIAHVGHNFGYETLMTELPTFMRQILHFNIKENGFLSSLPYLAMWAFSMSISCVADSLITKGKSRTIVRKVANGFGHYGPALALILASYTGCNPYLTVAILTIGVGLNGAVYSGFKVSHLDISPRFAGILMSLTNCTANLTGLLAPITAGKIIHGRPTQAAWRQVFFVSAAVYVVCNTLYIILGSNKRQSWDNPDEEEVSNKKHVNDTAPKSNVEESAH